MADGIEIPESFPAAGDVRDKRVVITGAGRGIGRLLAHAFSHAGAKVTLVSRTELDLEALAGELPSPALVCAGDVTDEVFIEGVADVSVEMWGGLDAWIVNAGIGPVVASARETDPNVWRQALDLNLTSAFLSARAAARVMHHGGRIVFTGSVYAERPAPGLSAFSASKAGLVALAKTMALELAPAIAVNVVALGADVPSTDIAGAYQYLVSDAAASVTGTVLSVDGGYLLR